jgi:hypothetical protein
VPSSTVLERIHPGKFAVQYPVLYPKNKKYFCDSQSFNIQGGVEVEVIPDPEAKIKNCDLLRQVISELGGILLNAFGKTFKDQELYLSGDRFTKVSIETSCLVVARKNGRPIAFSAGTFISNDLFYLNSAMMLREYQTSCVGACTTAVLGKWAIEQHQGFRHQDDLKVVLRTHNRNAASTMIKVFENGSKISTEPNLDPATRELFWKTAEHLKCPIDKETGICRDVYPGELPEGKKHSDIRIQRAFEKMGPRDGCFVVGSFRKDYLQRLLSRFIIRGNVLRSFVRS